MRIANRRAVFFATITSAAIVLTAVGWHWWYEADFTMPPLPPGKVFGLDFERLRWHLDQKQMDLDWWKDGREIDELELAGTSWEDNYHGLTLKFREDGFLILRPSPSKTVSGNKRVFLSPFSKQPYILSLEAMTGFLDQIDGSRYQFLSEATWPARQDWLMKSCPPNLDLIDSEWSAFLVPWEGSGRQLTLFFRSEDPAQKPSSTQHITFSEIFP
ncbi:MAG: hypothetical protein KDN19_00765 [Verrucomicrobiae bacterium]|nr:hypothetical protein [Verrucomicrobiae bacterium]